MEVQLQVGVKVLLKNSGGKYLMIKRSLTKYPNAKGRWDSVGGRINAGIGLLENLAREVKEETGLKILGKPELIAAQDILRVPGKHVVRLTYIARSKGKIELDKEENDEFRWLTLEEIKDLGDLDIYLKELLDNGAI